MKDNEKINKGLYSERGYISCINEGIVLATRNVVHILKYMWKYLIGCGILCGVLIWMAFKLFMDVSWCKDALYTVFSSSWYWLLAGGFVFLLCLSVYKAVIMYYVPRLIENGTLSLSEDLTFSMLRDTTIRSFSCSFLSFFVSALLFVPAWMLAGWSNLWIWLIFLVWCIVVLLPTTMCKFDQLIQVEHNWMQSFRAIRLGYVYWGALVLVYLCGALIRLMILSLVWLPTLVTAWALHDAAIAETIGEVVSLPLFLPSSFVLLCIFSSIISLVLLWASMFPMTYLYGSVLVREENRRKQS